MSDDAAPDADPRAFSATEEVPTTPGWVEGELDTLLAALPDRPSVRVLRARYLDDLAASGTEAARDRSRGAFLRGLERDGVDAGTRDAIEPGLIALEAEISTRT